MHRCQLLIAAVLCAAVPLTPALAQGAIKPLDARIVNTPSQPVPVLDKLQADAAGRSPYQQFVSFTPFFGNTSAIYCDQTNFGGCRISFTPVPAGKRLVITHAHARFTLTAANAWVNLTVPGEAGELTLPPVEKGPSSAPGGYLMTSTPITFYVEAGKTPAIEIFGQLGSAVSNVGVVGYLIDLQ